MPRGPRLDAPGALHHVIARGIERRPIFADDVDRRDFLDRLATLVERSRATLLAWCLLPNHVHLLIRTGTAPLSGVMRRLLAAYAGRFNRRHRRSGPLCQNRFKSILVEADPYLLQLVRYIHLNPVRARLVPSVAALARYRWTGHSVLVGHRPYAAQDSAAVLALFGASPRVARRAYHAFVLAGLASDAQPDLDGGGLRRSAGGWENLTHLRAGRERWRFDERVLGSSAFVERVIASAPLPAPRPRGAEALVIVERLCQHVALHCGVGAAEIRSRSLRRPVVTARAIVSHCAVTHFGLTLTATAAALSVSRQTVLRGVTAGPQALAATGMRAADPLRS